MLKKQEKKDLKEMNTKELKSEIIKYIAVLILFIIICIGLNIYSKNTNINTKTNTNNTIKYVKENNINTNLIKQDNEVSNKKYIDENKIEIEQKQEEDYKQKDLYNEYLEEQAIYQNYLNKK